MAFRKRTRSRRPMRRKFRRGTKKVSKPVKNYVQKSIASKLESKTVCTIDTITKPDITDGLGYYRLAPGQYITPGVTDRGRIGDTIYLTGITIKYVFTADIFSLAGLNRPLHWHWFIVQMKSVFAVPDDVWYKSFDSGATNAYVGLGQSAIQDGRRKINTNSFRVLSHRKVILHPGLGSNLTQSKTGTMITRMKMKKMKFISNSTTGSGLQELSPSIFVIGYPYDGGDLLYSDYNNFEMRFCVDITYKD